MGVGMGEGSSRVLYCQCCPQEGKKRRVKMAELNGDSIEIMTRQYGGHHYVRIPVAELIEHLEALQGASSGL